MNFFLAKYIELNDFFYATIYVRYGLVQHVKNSLFCDPALVNTYIIYLYVSYIFSENRLYNNL